jgi:hypothetical protein
MVINRKLSNVLDLKYMSFVHKKCCIDNIYSTYYFVMLKKYAFCFFSEINVSHTLLGQMLIMLYYLPDYRCYQGLELKKCLVS